MSTSSPRTAGHRQPERTTVNLVRTHRNQTGEPVEYSADFGKLFVEDMTRLYLLSYARSVNSRTSNGEPQRRATIFQAWRE